MTAILGVSAYYHDAAAALVVDGEIVAAAQEERFTRKKHDASFPAGAIAYCLAEAGLRRDQIDYVGFYDKPILKLDRILQTQLSFAPRGFASFLKAAPAWLKQKLHISRELSRGLEGAYRRRFIFTEHHESHAASAFYPSPFDDAAVLTVDGVGEWATASIGVGRGHELELVRELRFPHSLGLLYSAFTYSCGFKVNSGEYKLMGLAPYGTPKLAPLIYEKLLDLKEDGSFRLDLSYFDYCAGLRMTSRRFDALFGAPRRPETPLTEREMDLAASIQAVTEEILLRMGRHVHAVTGQRNLCLAGGVALNCVANGRLMREGPFERLWIQPAAGDAGGALGVALFIWHQLLGRPRTPRPEDAQSGSLLGPRFSDAQIAALLDEQQLRHRLLDEDALCDQVADLLAAGKVVGWFQGRMEFGPRALGGRSILGDARSPKMQSIMNEKIKLRESFRPFAPSVLAERAGEWFALDGQSPYMMLVAPVRDDVRLPVAAADETRRGLDRFASLRSQIPAVTHVDYSARIQTLDEARHGRYYRLVKRFAEKTGCPVVVNTSFNVRGEPIVCSPEEAIRCFLATDMDALVLERALLLKSEQTAPAVDKRDHQRRFELD